MNIITKFGIGDIVYILHKNEVINGKIWRISVTAGGKKEKYYEEQYMIIKENQIVVGAEDWSDPYYGDYFNAEKVFKTKEELLLSL